MCHHHVVILFSYAVSVPDVSAQIAETALPSGSFILAGTINQIYVDYPWSSDYHCQYERNSDPITEKAHTALLGTSANCDEMATPGGVINVSLTMEISVAGTAEVAIAKKLGLGPQVLSVGGGASVTVNVGASGTATGTYDFGMLPSGHTAWLYAFYCTKTLNNARYRYNTMKGYRYDHLSNQYVGSSFDVTDIYDKEEGSVTYPFVWGLERGGSSSSCTASPVPEHKDRQVKLDPQYKGSSISFTSGKNWSNYVWSPLSTELDR